MNKFKCPTCHSTNVLDYLWCTTPTYSLYKLYCQDCTWEWDEKIYHEK